VHQMLNPPNIIPVRWEGGKLFSHRTDVFPSLGVVRTGSRPFEDSITSFSKLGQPWLVKETFHLEMIRIAKVSSRIQLQSHFRLTPFSSLKTSPARESVGNGDHRSAQGTKCRRAIMIGAAKMITLSVLLSPCVAKTGRIQYPKKHEMLINLRSLME